MIISDIHTYDIHPNRNKKETLLLLSLDKDFKSRVCEVASENSIIIGFSENLIQDIKNFAEYFKYFVKVLKEVDTVIIDGNFYSYAIMIIHSSALNMENIKRVDLYVDDNNPQDLKFTSRDQFPAPISNKERTYSRQQFLNGRNI